MEYINTRFSFDTKNRRYSTCSFSTYSRMSFSEGEICDVQIKEEPVFYSVSEPNFSIRQFTPQIIISPDESQKKLCKKVTVNRADCIRKRIKTHFNQFLLKLINKKINSEFPNISLGKLSQIFIADVKIESNKHYIIKPIKYIFSHEFKGSKNLLSNKRAIDSIYQSKSEELRNFLDTPYCEFFKIYLESEFYSSDLRKFLRKEGENYAYMYKKYSKELIEYYLKGIPYKSRRSYSKNESSFN